MWRAVVCRLLPRHLTFKATFRTLQVGYGEADVGVCYIGYFFDFVNFVDYSHPLGESSFHWISKPPGKLSPATNILRIFDPTSWLMLGVSILSVIAASLVISKVGRSYGEEIVDNFVIFIYPLATLTSENMSDSFKKKNKKRNKNFFSPGFARNGLYLIWTVMAAFISMAFLSMIRTVFSTLNG